jgi:hypothetical protein
VPSDTFIFGSAAESVGKRAAEKGAPWKSPKPGLSHCAWKSSNGLFPHVPPPRLRRLISQFHRRKKIAELQKTRLVSRLPTQRPIGRGDQLFQLQVKTILNRVQRFVGFIYQEVQMHSRKDKPDCIESKRRSEGGTGLNTPLRVRNRPRQCRRKGPR